MKFLIKFDIFDKIWNLRKNLKFLKKFEILKKIGNFGKNSKYQDFIFVILVKNRKS